MNVARLNLSHGTLAEHLARMKLVRRLARELGTYVAIMFDTRGPDLRIGNLVRDPVELKEGDRISLSAKDCMGTPEKVSVNWPGLIGLLEPGDAVFLNDGMIELKVESRTADNAVCAVVAGGMLKSHKGINVPGKKIPLPILTVDDISDLKTGIAISDDETGGIDYVSASFVNSADDVRFIRESIGECDVGIIAKIESAEGVKNLEEITRAADGVMVARGDLGIEIPPEEVPGVQKHMIRLSRELRKPVITATEMLESMIHAARPTRAEITDVANAVLDGTSAVMLSAETAAGEYPLESVRMMARICKRAEEDLKAYPIPTRGMEGHESVRAGIASAACRLASDIGATAIVCVTDTGATAGIFSHLRPSQSVLACTSDIRVAQHLSLFWGVVPVVVDAMETVEDLLNSAVKLGRARGLIGDGGKIVFTGNLSGRRGETNLLAVVEV
jgi:pyruvate kinase